MRKDGVEGNDSSSASGLSGKGSHVLIRTNATNLSSQKCAYVIANVENDDIFPIPLAEDQRGLSSSQAPLSFISSGLLCIGTRGPGLLSGSVVSLDDGKIKAWSIETQAINTNEMSTQVSVDGTKLLYWTNRPLDKDRDTNNQADLYVVKFSDALDKVSIDQSNSRDQDTDQKKMPTPEPMGKDPKAADPVDANKQIIGKYIVKGIGPDGVAVEDVLTIHSNQTVSLQGALKFGVDTIKVEVNSNSLMTIIQGAAKNDNGANVHLLFMVMNGNPTNFTMMVKGKNDIIPKNYILSAKKVVK